jgi:hypothetical protein
VIVLGLKQTVEVVVTQSLWLAPFWLLVLSGSGPSLSAEA